MEAKEIEETQDICKRILVSKMLNYVREHGEDVTDYDRNNFGLLEDEESHHVTKVLNFFDNGGCCFTIQSIPNCEDDDNFTTYAVHCLYIEVDEYEREWLMSYSLYNAGAKYDADEQEPDHESMLNESLTYVNEVAKVLATYEAHLEQPEQSEVETKTELEKAIAYVKENLDKDDLAIIHANINKAYRSHLMPENICNTDRVIELLEEYGQDNELPEEWWEENGDINDILFKL